MLDVIKDKVSDKGSTEGFSYIFGRAVPTASEPETVEKKISYRQVDVVLDDDKTVVMTAVLRKNQKLADLELGMNQFLKKKEKKFSLLTLPVNLGRRYSKSYLDSIHRRGAFCFS